MLNYLYKQAIADSTMNKNHGLDKILKNALHVESESKPAKTIVLNQKFKNLVPDFSYLESVLDGNPEQKLLELSKELFVPYSNKKLVTVPKQKGMLYFCGDLHGNLTDFQNLMIEFFNETQNDLKEGKKNRFVLLGDYVHALNAYDEKGNVLGSAYPDKSIQILSQVMALRGIFGNGFVPLIGDHELPIIFPGFDIYKDNVDLTKVISEKLTPEENKYLENEMKKLPLVLIANRYAFSHTGPAPMIKSIDDLENLVLEYNLDMNDKNFDAKKEEWGENTPLGRLTFGKVDENHSRIFLEEETNRYAKTLDVDELIYAHSTNAQIIYEKNGKLIAVPQTIKGHERYGKQFFIATTEGAGCEHKRNGINNEGPNEYGEYGAIDLNAEHGTMYVGEMKDISKKNKSLFKNGHSQIVNDLEYALFDCCYQRKCFPEEWYDGFAENAKNLEKEIKAGKIDWIQLIPELNCLKSMKAENIPKEILAETDAKELFPHLAPYLK